MSFLQPFLMAGLPLVALPIIIHLINRQRHRTKPWAAMMFLLSAKRMTRGMARLRHFLIMAMRMLAIAALIFAVSRPLASGWLGLAAGGRPATVIIVLDRSASMEQQDLQSNQSKRSVGLSKLVNLVETLGSATRVVLIENTETAAREIESPDALFELPETSATATSADIPAMLQEAAEYIAANQTGRTDVWICSDLRAHDWDSESGRWEAIRQAFGPQQGVRFHLLSYTSPPRDNISVWVGNVKRRQADQSTELVFDVRLRRDEGLTTPTRIPLAFVINGARSVLDVEMTEQEYALQGHVIPIDKRIESGWGRVELPADTNPQDNVFYFVFGPQPERRTVIVSDDSRSADALRLATKTPADPAITCVAEVITAAQTGEIDWDRTAMILWQSELPDGAMARQLQQFIERGRTIVFFPPEQPGGNTLFGGRWVSWNQTEQNAPVTIGTWRDDSGLLRNTLSGASLPVGDLKTYRYCGLDSDGSILARFDNGDSLLTQANTNDGEVYFCTTWPRASHSSLARDGVVFYVMLQRALEGGAASLSNVKQLTAGEGRHDSSQWQPMPTGQDAVLSSERAYHSGAYQNGEQLLALNRPEAEDRENILSDSKIGELFGGLDYFVVNDQLDSGTALASEIWKTFLVAMAIALIIEALLCVPPKKETSSDDAPDAISQRAAFAGQNSE